MLSIPRFREILSDISLCPCAALSMCPVCIMYPAPVRIYQ
jgi:hypothetical protein